MKITNIIAAAALVGSMGLAGCTTADTNSAIIGGGLGTAAAVIAGGNTEAILLSAAAGAAAGVIIGRVAQNSRDCYYSNGRGGYYVARCR